MPFCTILHKLHSFKYYIQDDWSTRFFCTTNYSIDHIIKRFHEVNSLPGLFSKKNLVLCDMQGNDYGILVKTIKKIPKINFSASRTGSHFWQNQICTLQHDREFVMFRFYFPLFIKLFMVLLCVIFKSEWYLRAAFWVFLHAMFMFDWKQPVQRWKLREGLLTINKINIIRWNMYRDNNFHSRREVLRVKCLWKSWVR